MAGYDEFGTGNIHHGPVSGPERGPTPSIIFRSSSPPDREETRDLDSPGSGREGTQPHHGPVHTHLASEAARLATFQDWPPGLSQKKEEMAAAGLFYIGLSDQVKCFYCDGGLKEWQQEDDPWVEHAGWFHQCEFIKLVKGEQFIQRCRDIVHNNLEERKREKEKNKNQVQTENPSQTPAPSPTPSPPTSPVSATSGEECSTSSEMQVENAQMKRQMRCKVCLNADVGVVFLPCGHLVVCKNCAPNLRSCPVCRRRINETIKVFMS